MYQVLIVLASVCALACGLGISLPVAPKEDLIVGGTDADIKDYPFMLSLEKNGEPICDASMISASYALTDASCVADDATYTLRAGSSNLGEGGTLHKVSNIILNPGYDPSTKDNSIAILETEDPFDGSEIGLDEIEPATGDECTTAYFNGQGQLKSDNVHIVDHNNCRLMYAPDEDITDSKICAAELTDATWIDGNPGGALICKGALSGVRIRYNNGGVWDPLRPGVYTLVAQQDPWIESEINK